MEFSVVVAVLLIMSFICDEAQTAKEKICIKYDFKNTSLSYYPMDMYRICELRNWGSVQSAFVTEDFVQLFYVSTWVKSLPWNSEAQLMSGNAYPEYITESTGNQSGRFMKAGAFETRAGQLNQVSASFLHFSDCVNDFGYLISGLSAHEFVIREGFYWSTGKVKPITDFFKEGEMKLLMPEDKLKEVVSVALIKWVEKDKIKDHALYKIILKTVTKKLVKAYFKVTSKGEVISLNSEPFLPSTEVLPEDDLNLLEESALFYVREVDMFSIGYQFIKALAFPIYYDYNPETNTYKEYPMRTKEGFNAELEQLVDTIPYWNRHIVPMETWLGCPDQTFCLGRSFDAIFKASNFYRAIFENMLYNVYSLTEKPESWYPLDRYVRDRLTCYVDAAFSAGMVFFIKDDRVFYMKDIHSTEVSHSKLTEVFPGIGVTSVSAVITIDKVQEANKKQPEPSYLKSGGMEKYHRIDESAAQMFSNYYQKMLYVYSSTKKGWNVYQYEMEAKRFLDDPPKFKLVAKKPFKEVNAALPKSVSLVFTAEDKVVTMVNHFMIEQSSETFFTQTETQAKFTLVDQYFGCQRENLEKELTKEFVQKYIEFAAPKPGATVKPDCIDALRIKMPREPNGHSESTSESHCPTPEDSSTENSEEVSLTSTENSDLGLSISSSKESEQEASSSAENADKVWSTEETHESPSVKKDEDKNEVKSSAMSAKISSFIRTSVIFILIKFYYN